MTQSEEDLRELVGYLQNIRSFERDHLISERSTIGMIWGLLIIIGGIIDLYIASLLNFSPHAPVWFSVIAAAIIAQQIISSQPLLYEETFTDELKRENIPLWEIVLTLLIMLFTIVIGNWNVAYVMPYISFTFGTTNAIALVRSGEYPLKSVLPVVSFFLAGVLSLGFYLIDDRYQVLSGFIFGLVVGSAIFTGGFLSRKKLVAT